jgi:hypothetical protein
MEAVQHGGPAWLQEGRRAEESRIIYPPLLEQEVHLQECQGDSGRGRCQAGSRGERQTWGQSGTWLALGPSWTGRGHGHPAAE